MPRTRRKRGNELVVAASGAAPTAVETLDQTPVDSDDALRQSEERLRLATRAGRVGVWDWVLRGNRVTWSDSLYEIHGLKAGTFDGTLEAFAALVHADDRPMVSDAIERSLRGEAPYEVEFRAVRPDNQVVWLYTSATVVREDGQAVRMLGATVDITERKRAEQALRESQERLGTLMSLLPVGVYACDADGRFTFFNRQAVQWWGREPALHDEVEKFCACYRLYGLDGALIPPEQTPMAVAVREGRSFRDVEAVVERPDGTRFVASVSIDPIRDAEGNLCGAINVFQDITHRKEAEDLLRRHKDELEQRVAERTARLRALALQLTHAERRERKRLAQVLHDDIQQILAAVKLQASMAAARAKQPDSLREVLRLTDAAIAASRSLTLGLSPPVLRDADLAMALHWLARSMGEQYGLKVSVHTDDPAPDLSEDLRMLAFDITRELLFNVIKHAGVDCAEVTLGRENGHMFVEVRDQGKGCRPEALEQPGRESFGLFSIRERLADLGGRLEASTNEGGGCRVRMSVPALEAAPAPAAVAEQPAAPRPNRPARRTGTLSILLADDHQTMRQGLAQLLSSQPDMRVVAQASDGLEALRMARKHKPDIVVMDVTMPRMNGADATRAIRAVLPHTRVVGLSMHDHQDMAAAMRDAGAEILLSKCGPVEQLLATLRGEA